MNSIRNELIFTVIIAGVLILLYPGGTAHGCNVHANAGAR